MDTHKVTSFNGSSEINLPVDCPSYCFLAVVCLCFSKQEVYSIMLSKAIEEEHTSYSSIFYIDVAKRSIRH